MGGGIGGGYDTPSVGVIQFPPQKLPPQDKEDNLVYVLRKEFEVPGQLACSEIVAVSTKKDMIFDTAKDMAKQEFYKPRDLGKWDFVVLVFDNKSGRFLDKVNIPQYQPGEDK